MKRSHEITINNALQTNDASAIGQAVFASIQMLESGQFLCNDITNPNSKNLVVEIKSLPTLKKKAITLLKRHNEIIQAAKVGAERRRQTEKNTSRPQAKRRLFDSAQRTNRRLLVETPQTAIETPRTNDGQRSRRRIETNLAEASRKGIEVARIASARRLQNIQNVHSIPDSRSVSNVRMVPRSSTHQIPSTVRSSRSLVDASQKGIENARRAAERRLQRNQPESIRPSAYSGTNLRSTTPRPRENTASRRRMQSVPRRIENIETPAVVRRPISYQSVPHSMTTRVAPVLSEAALRRHERAMEKSRHASERRMRNAREIATPSETRARRELTEAEKKAYVDRQRIQRENIERIQATGVRRKQAAQQASHSVNRFGSTARIITLPPSSIPKSVKSRAGIFFFLYNII